MRPRLAAIALLGRGSVYTGLDGDGVACGWLDRVRGLLQGLGRDNPVDVYEVDREYVQYC